MHTIRSFQELTNVSHNACLAIGVFDGVHLGHQRVIGQACEDARASGGTAVVLTFDPHPIRVLAPDKAPLLLTSTTHKLRLIEQLGADVCLLVTFDHDFAQMPPEKFIELVTRSTNRLQEICVGTRFRFGHDRVGDVKLIEHLASRYGYHAKEIKPVILGKEMVSSTALRQHVLQGNLDRAAELLGRRFSVLGSVVPGEKIGHKLGYPTANIDAHNEVIPPDGVYVVRVVLAGKKYGGVANIGVRPTVAGQDALRRLEVHILDFAGSVYDDEIEVVFLKKLRDEQKFASLDALREQIGHDAQVAREHLQHG